MAAYVIFLREGPVEDPEAMAQYRSTNRAGADAFPMTVRAVYGRMVPLEGALPDGVVILEFPSVAEAKAWYDSPGYQAAVPHRLRAAPYRAFIVEGYEA